MHEDILKAIQGRVQSLHYVVTVHAEEEMEDDGLSIFDVEAVILSGEIVERQRDSDRGEWKYVIDGWTADRQRVAVVARLGPATSVVLITVFRT